MEGLANTPYCFTHSRDTSSVVLSLPRRLFRLGLEMRTLGTCRDLEVGFLSLPTLQVVPGLAANADTSTNQ